jgi:hypothetical protein
MLFSVITCLLTVLITYFIIWFCRLQSPAVVIIVIKLVWFGPFVLVSNMLEAYTMFLCCNFKLKTSIQMVLPTLLRECLQESKYFFFKEWANRTLL